MRLTPGVGGQADKGQVAAGLFRFQISLNVTLFVIISDVRIA